MCLAALVCATGLFALSCKKETLTPEEQKAQEEQEKAEKTEQFWDVVGQLVAASDIGQDYKDFTIGIIVVPNIISVFLFILKLDLSPVHVVHGRMPAALCMNLYVRLFIITDVVNVFIG